MSEAHGGSPEHTTLTVAERDALDAAKQRAKDVLTLVMATLNQDDVLIVGSDNDDEDSIGAVIGACEIMRESIDAINNVLSAADERRIAGRQNPAAGGDEDPEAETGGTA